MMVAGLETFAKVRALHDRATIPGEKAAAASRMEALARSAGLSVDEAMSKLDAAPTGWDEGVDWADIADALRKAAEAADATAEPDAPSRRRGLPIYDPHKIEPWRNVAEHCVQLDWIIPKAHGGRFLTKDQRACLKAIARHYSPVTNATADWIETVLARCETARQSWRDRGKAGARPDRKATESDIEQAAELVAAAKRREASKLDTSASEPPTHAHAAADAFNAFFNSPEMRASFAEQDRKRQARRAEILARYGTVEAVYAETDREAALRVACEPFTIWDRRPDYEGCYTLSGWNWIDGRHKVPVEAREAVAAGWPLPATVKAAWAEYAAADAHESERHVMHDYEHHPALWTEVRRHILEDLLDTLPAASIGDMLARQSWMEHTNEIGVGGDTTKLLSTLRADIERMGARIRERSPQNGTQYCRDKLDTCDGNRSETAPKRDADQTAQSGRIRGHADRHTPSDSPPVQTGHPRRTNADKRRDVLALLNLGISQDIALTDREIARRAGVSPTTVGTIRRSMA